METVSVTMSHPVITKVVMVEGGKKGLSVQTKSTMSRNGIRTNVEIPNAKHKRPVHKELRVLFKDLRQDFLSMLGFSWKKESELEMLKSMVSVDSVMVNDKSNKIQLSGRVGVGGARMYGVSAAMVSVDEYDEPDAIKEIVKKLIMEAGFFIDGSKGMERKEMSVGYMTVKKGIDNAEEAYDKLSAQEKEEMLTLAFEDCGLDYVEEDGKMVIVPSELEGAKKSSDSKSKGSEIKAPKMEAVSALESTPKMAVDLSGDSEEVVLPMDFGDDEAPQF